MPVSSPSQPNFVVFLTDDQGYGDLSCMGATDFKTPHIDAMAADGARCTNWYSNSPVCSPSRAALLTGRYPGNAGVRAILGGRRNAAGLPAGVPTLATALKPLGYRTAMFGKWHLGLAEGSRPHDHGFEEWFGFMAGCIDYYSHIFYWGMNQEVVEGERRGRAAQLHDLWEDGREVWHDGEYFTDLLAERAVAFIRKVAREGRPFFLYLPFNAPHYPMHAPQRYRDRFPDLPWERRIMAAMLSAVDDAVGAVRDELERQGLTEQTVLYYQSDNGPSRESRNWLDGRLDPYYGGSAGRLKGHKFSLFEGGIRSPGILTWPARIPSGRVVDQVGAAMDIFPTLLRAAGGEPRGYELDGLDVLPMVADGAPSPHAELFWEMGKQTAVRRGEWKLVLHGQLVEGAPPEDEVFLANLADDEGERVNRAAQHPALVQELRAAAERWRAGIEARWEREWRPGMTGLTSRA
ncbi:MAG TPA: sulfatase-like hydrolase/transferase [Chloroflexota bacterium]|nr:sulfatase-like hydrolase/transferase [Chloroflexota bacterium]